MFEYYRSRNRTLGNKGCLSSILYLSPLSWRGMERTQTLEPNRTMCKLTNCMALHQFPTQAGYVGILPHDFHSPWCSLVCSLDFAWNWYSEHCGPPPRFLLLPPNKEVFIPSLLGVLAAEDTQPSFSLGIALRSRWHLLPGKPASSDLFMWG